MEEEYNLLSAKIRFIIDIIDGNIIIMNIKIKDIEEQLEKKEYYKNNDNYDYLLRMPISQLTMEKKEALEKEVKLLKDKIDNLKDMSIVSIWENELNDLLIEWNKHKIMIEEDYENDLKGDTTPQKSKKTYQKKK